jgi:hypothetical protein
MDLPWLERNPRPISLRGHELPYVQHFRYLGSYFSADCSLDKEISWRLTAAGAAVQRAAKLWRSREMSTRTNAHIWQLGAFGPVVWSRVLAHHALPAAAA